MKSPPAPRHASISSSNVRGYCLKSSLGPNCAGFTKIETITRSHSRRAAWIKLRWPACSAPIVGTSPILAP